MVAVILCMPGLMFPSRMHSTYSNNNSRNISQCLWCCHYGTAQPLW